MAPSCVPRSVRDRRSARVEALVGCVDRTNLNQVF